MQQQMQQHQKYKQAQEKAEAESQLSNKKKFTSIEAGESNADMIQEEIQDEVNELQPNRPGKPGDPLQSSDNLLNSGISSSGANAIDHSIDTL